jgi:L-ribulose-5-phosphate 3-epimerase
MTNTNSYGRIKIDSSEAGLMSVCGQTMPQRTAVILERSVRVIPFGANTYSYMRSHLAAACLMRLAELGFREFEMMVHPGHLWPADLSTAERRDLRNLIERNGWTLTALNMPNIDINVAAAAPGMRAYSLALLEDTMRLAGELGARGLVIGPGKANPLFPADASELIGYFYAALDRLCPVAEQSGIALWLENMPFAFLPGIGECMDALARYGNDALRIVYDIANAYFIGEDFASGLKICRDRLALVHLSDTGRQLYRHDPVGLGTVPFAGVPRALAAVRYMAHPMLEIVSHEPDRDIVASAEKLAHLGFAPSQHSFSKQGSS